MCAPTLIQSVREDISRRGFLTVLGGAVAASAIAKPIEAQQKPVRLAKGFREVHDLTHPFTSRTPVFPAFKPVQIKPKFSIAKDGFFANEITFDEHTGTHMDAPAHFVSSGATADREKAERSRGHQDATNPSPSCATGYPTPPDCQPKCGSKP